MFASPSWSHDPFHRFTTPSHPHPYPIHTYACPPPQSNTHYHDYPHKSDPPRRPSGAHHRSDYNQARRRTHIEPESSDFTDVEYDLDTESSFDNRQRTPRYHSIPTTTSTPCLRTLTVQTPASTSSTLKQNTILILPPTLTHLRIQIRTPHSTDTLHAAVAGDISLRDVAKQLLPAREWREARVYAKLKGEWQETGALVMLSGIGELGRFGRNVAGEVEVRIVVGGGGGDRGRRRRTSGQRGMRGVDGMEREKGRERVEVKGWEREMARLDRMRLY
jgi:hypothetical protein